MRSLALGVLTAFLLVGSAVAAPSTAGRTEFDVLRNGQPFGRHTVSVTGSGGDYTAETRVNLHAGLGPVTVFRYEQSCTEQWRAGALAGLQCSTLKEGRRTRVSAVQQDSRLRVTGAGGDTWFPLGAAPASWWTAPPSSGATMINTETGARLPATVTNLGEEMIDAGGTRIRAQHIQVRGTLTLDLWYDAQGRWVGCAFTIRGQRIQYRLASPLGAAPA